jgi:hypothetical protein
MVGWALLLPAQPATHAPATLKAVRAGEQLQAGNLVTVLEAIAAAPHIALAIWIGSQDLRKAHTTTQLHNFQDAQKCTQLHRFI